MILSEKSATPDQVRGRHFRDHALTPRPALGGPALLRRERLLDAIPRGVLLLPGLEPEVELADDQDHAHRDEHGADRALDEHQDVAAGDQHGAAEVLLEARP